jgi:hypothetical protein
MMLLLQAYAETLGEEPDLELRRKILGDATRGQRLLLGYYFYWDDVTNGGHPQYFENYTSDLWELALEATEAFNTPDREFLKEALALFPDGRPAATDLERRMQLEEISYDQLEDIDVKTYEAPGSVESIQAYIESHPEEFFLPGEEVTARKGTSKVSAAKKKTSAKSKTKPKSKSKPKAKPKSKTKVLKKKVLKKKKK